METSKNVAETNTVEKTGKPIVVSRVIRDVQSRGLEGVKVAVKNSEQFVVSNNKGGYSLKVKTGDILLFSSKGFSDKEVKVTTAEINVKLESGNN